MSTFHQLFRYAFEQGCGLDFDQIRKSSRFQRRLRHELRLYERYRRQRSGKGLIERSPSEISRLIHHWNRNRSDIYWSPLRITYSRRALYHRALLHTLGDELIKAGQRCLTPTARRLAKAWRQDGSNHFEIVAELYNHFCDMKAELYHLREKEDEEDQTQETDSRFDWVDSIYKDYHPEDVLPHQQGPFGPGNRHPPSCLGFAIILHSWARLARAEALLVNVVKPPEEKTWPTEATVSQLLLDEVRERQLFHNPRFISGLQSNIETASVMRHYTMDFHAAIAVRTMDTCWSYIDPYIGHVGPLFRHWFPGPECSSVAFKMFGDVCPGLSVINHDRGYLGDWTQQTKRSVQRGIELADDLTKVLGELPTNHELRWALWRLDDHPAIKLLAQYHPRLAAEHRPSYNAFAHGFGWKEGDPEPEQWGDCYWELYLKDPDFRDEVHDRIVLAVLVATKRRFNNSQVPISRGGNVLPSCLELSMPAFNLGLQVMNNLRCWGPFRDLSPAWFLRHSGNQIFWHEATLLGEKVNYDDLDQALHAEGEKAIRAIYPHHHRAVRLKLAALDRERKEVNQCPS